MYCSYFVKRLLVQIFKLQQPTKLLDMSEILDGYFSLKILHKDPYNKIRVNILFYLNLTIKFEMICSQFFENISM